MPAPAKGKSHTIKYIKLDGFKTTQVHGVYGGMNLRGQLNMVFYVEAVDLPKSNSVPVVNSRLGKEVFEPQNSSIRELQFGINIDVALAKEIVTWITNHIEQFEALQNKLNAGTNPTIKELP